MHVGGERLAGVTRLTQNLARKGRVTVISTIGLSSRSVSDENHIYTRLFFHSLHVAVRKCRLHSYHNLELFRRYGMWCVWGTQNKVYFRVCVRESCTLVVSGFRLSHYCFYRSRCVLVW